MPVWTGTIDGEPLAVQVRPILNGYHLAHRGMSRRGARLYAARGGTRRADAREKGRRVNESAALPDAGPGQGDLGEEGQEVKAGEALCIVEAMKMENVLRAERDVTIAKIIAKEGDCSPSMRSIMEFA